MYVEINIPLITFTYAQIVVSKEKLVTPTPRLPSN